MDCLPRDMEVFSQRLRAHFSLLAKKFDDRISSPVRVHLPSPPHFGSDKIVDAKCQIDLYIKHKKF